MNQLFAALQLFWSWFKVTFQVLYGSWKIAKLSQPVVSIFGGSRFKEDNPYVAEAHDLAGRLMQNNISILTGGGNGIMKGANCGAVKYAGGKAKSIGIGVRTLNEPRNNCVQEYFELDYFFARKWLLTHYSQAFIIFPGGFGTLDELSEILTLIQTKNLKPVPVILVGTEYWKGFTDWITAEIVSHKLLPEHHLKIFKVTDSLDEAFCLAVGVCKVK